MTFDRVLISYPKSGRSWLWYAACLAISKQYGLKTNCINDEPLNIDKRDLFSRAALPIPTSTHAMYGTEAKTRATHRCLLARDPRDIIVSTFFWRGRSDWSLHVDMELAALRRWKQSWENQDFEWGLTYENLKSDFRLHLKLFLEWLGAEWSDGSLDYAREMSTFDRMQAKSRVTKKCRKGIVGDWRNYLTDEQSAEILRCLQSGSGKSAVCN